MAEEKKGDFPYSITIVDVVENEDESATLIFEASKEAKEWLCGEGLKAILVKYLEEETKVELKDD